jgi:hypothetical protein
MIGLTCFKCGKFGPFRKLYKILAEGSKLQEGESPQQARTYALILTDEDREKFADMEIDT